MCALLLFLLLGTASANILSLLKSPGDAIALPKTAGQDVHISHSLPKVQNAVDVVSLIYQMLPCNKIATSMLMDSCSAPLETTSNVLDSLGTIYGTRLAVCELYNAGADIPRACADFVPSPELIRKATASGVPARASSNNGKGSSIYNTDTAAASKKCTQALFQKPQSWTSFSNSKQNSLAICQAMRVEIDKEQLIGVLADVKIQSVEFNETAHTSLLALQRLHELALLTHRQYADSNADVLRAAEALTHRLNSTTSDLSEMSTSAVDASMAMASIELQFDSMMRQVFEQVYNLSLDAAGARKDLTSLGEGLGYVGRQLESTQQTIMLMEKTTLAYAESVQESFSFLQDIPEPALRFMQTTFDSISFLTADGPRIYVRFVNVVTTFAVFLGSSIAVYPVYRYKGGYYILTAMSASLGFGMAYSAFHSLSSHALDLLERDGHQTRPALIMIAIAIAAAGAGLGVLLCLRKKVYHFDEDRCLSDLKKLPQHKKTCY